MLPPHKLCRVDGCRRNWNTGNVRGQFCWEINLKLKWAYTVVDVWCCLIALALSMYSCRMSTSLPWWPSHSLAASSPSSVSWWASSRSPTSGQFHQSFRCFMLIFIGIKTYDWSQLLSLIPKSTVLLHYLVTNPSHLFILFLVFVIWFIVCSRNLQCDRNTIHKNLVLSLMLAEIVFIIGISLVQDRVSFLASSYNECENTIQPNIIDKMRKRSSD